MTKNNIGILLFTSALLLTGCGPEPNGPSESSAQPSLEQLQQDIDAYLGSLHREGDLNGNVLVVQNGEKLYQRSFGFADGSQQDPLSKDFRFGIGSIYKEFPAAAIMQLHEKNLIRLNDNVAQYLPQLPQWAQTVSVENLLRYSGGLPRIQWGQHFSRSRAVREDDLMSDLLELKELAFTPGTGYLYTNYSPFLLIKIVETVSGQSFSQYAEEHLFRPFGLTTTVFSPQYPYPDRTLMAMPFDSNGDEDQYQIEIPMILLSATAEDLYQWLEHLHSFEVIGEGSLIGLTQTATIDANEEMEAPLGQCTVSEGKIVEHTHHGSSGNYEALIRRFNASQLTIVVLTNRKAGNLFAITEEIRERVSGSP